MTTIDESSEQPEALDQRTGGEAPGGNGSQELSTVTGDPALSEELEFERAQLLTRLVVGLALMGEGRLWERLRLINDDVQAQLQQETQVTYTGDESAADLVRYVGLGMFTRGQKKVLGGIRSGFQLTLNSASWLLRTADTATDNRLARPVRRRMEARLQSVEQSLEEYLNEGRREEEQSRALASETVDVMMGEVFDYIARDPEIAAFIRDLVGQQSMGLAGVVSDNARKASTTGDDLVESAIRRLLRKKPRRELPPSPLEGAPQTMYEPETESQGIDPHDR